MKVLVGVFLVLLAAVQVFAADAPQWTGDYVNDYANAFSNRAELEGALRQIEQNTKVEFAIVTVANLPFDETKETYAYKILNTWGIGKKSEDNGLLLMIITNGTPGNRLRLEVGYGLEGYITDAAAGRMLDDALPYYENGDYSKAAAAVVADVEAALQNKDYISGYKPQSSYKGIIVAILPFIFMIFIFMPFLLAHKLSKPKCPNCGSKDMHADGNYMVCRKCKKRYRKATIYPVPVFIGGTGGNLGGGGFGGGGGGGGGGGR